MKRWCVTCSHPWISTRCGSIWYYELADAEFLTATLSRDPRNSDIKIVGQEKINGNWKRVLTTEQGLKGTL